MSRLGGLSTTRRLRRLKGGFADESDEIKKNYRLGVYHGDVCKPLRPGGKWHR